MNTQSKLFHNFLIIAVITLLSIAIFLLWAHIERTHNQFYDNFFKRKNIDTVYVHKSYEAPKVVNNYLPSQVQTYIKHDTIYRVTLEHQKIISHVDIKQKEVDITTVDTAGKVSNAKYLIDLQGVKQVTVGDSGQVNVRKFTKAGKALRNSWKFTKNKLVPVATGVILTVLLTKFFK